MRILLDESVPVQVRNALAGHDVSTVMDMKWRGIARERKAGRIKVYSGDLEGDLAGRVLRPALGVRRWK